MIFGPSGPTLEQLGIEAKAEPESDQAAAPPKLPEQIERALIDAEIDPAETAEFTDNDLLAVSGIGPAALEQIRAAESD